MKVDLKSFLILTLKIVAIIIFLRLFLVDVFKVSSGSMEDTMQKGDFIIVNKLQYGCRLPISFTSISYLDFLTFPYYRLPELKKVEVGDIIAFNLPKNFNLPIDQKDVYVKRCAGIPCDTIKSINGYFYINGHPFDSIPEIKKQYFIFTNSPFLKSSIKREQNTNRIYDLDEKLFTYIVETNLNDLKNIISIHMSKNIQISTKVTSVNNLDPAFLKQINKSWDQNDFSSIIIPGKNLIIKMDSNALCIYGDIIRRENIDSCYIKNNKLYLNHKIQEYYKFKKDYFFALGDNRDNSQDSRFWGFVPDDHLIGNVVNH